MCPVERRGSFYSVGYMVPKEDIMRLAFANPTGWRSDKAFPFCEVYHYQHWDKQLFSDTALDSYHWIAKLAATVTKRDEIVKAVALSTPKSSVATCHQTLKLGREGEKFMLLLTSQLESSFGGSCSRLMSRSTRYNPESAIRKLPPSFTLGGPGLAKMGGFRATPTDRMPPRGRESLSECPK